MKKLGFVIDIKNYLFIGAGVIAFSNFLISLFGQTIPNIIWTFFKDVGELVVITSVFIFALTWLLKSRPPKKPKEYSVMVYDIFGNESSIEGLRTVFKTHDVAWSFMKLYKQSYPLHNFALVSEFANSNKKTIFRYI